jgi:two-component system, OmpR family, phosphate regulon sensor histidine kinase PhoR
MQPRIRWRKALPFLALLILGLVFFTLGGLDIVRRQDQVRWKSQLVDLARLIASSAQVEIDNFGESADLNRLAAHCAETLEIAVLFISPEGLLLGSSEPNNPLSPIQINDLIEQVSSEGQATWVRDGGVTVGVAIRGMNEEPLGFVFLQAPSDRFRLDLTPLWNLGAIVILVALVIGLILAMIIQEHAIKPVENLIIAVQQMRSGNFYNLEFPDGSNELNDLSQSLKDMAQHLGDQIDTLTTERAKLSAVLNQMTDGVLIADPEGRVQLLNPAAERIFQVGAKRGLQRSVVEVLRYHQLVDLWRVAREGQRQTTMLEIGPQHLFLQVTGMPLKASLKGSTLILFQDLTQLRRLETVRRDFISNVSHELRTPLASLKALAETLQEGALDDPPAARRFIFRMETEIDNLTQLVNELLELSRIESGKVPLSFHRIQPCDLLSPAYERMALQVERAGLTLVMDCPPDLPAVFADPDRITQVMINLIHNALKFTPPGGQITLSAYRDGDYMVFFVKDSGVGIPKKDLSRIFERFYKADRARTGGGTGLGLSIARHMVESHGGFIWAESEEELGSTLYFSLPVA